MKTTALVSRRAQTVNGLLEVTKRNGSTGWVQGIEINGRAALGFDLSLNGRLAWQDFRQFPLIQPSFASALP